MGLGGIGTVGTLICMIIDSKKKAKQIDVVQRIQSHQLELLYAPDIRISSWLGNINDGMHNKIVISNLGDNLTILDIKTLSGSNVLNKEGMSNWFPYDFNRNSEFQIPISVNLNDVSNNSSFGIVCFNKLRSKYLVPIKIVRSMPIVQSPILQQ